VRAQSTPGWFAFTVRVNGVEFDEASLRPDEDGRSNLEVVIRDRLLGSFALHEEFLLEVPEGSGDNNRWRQVSLKELRHAIRQEVQRMDSEFGWRPSPSSSPSNDPPTQSRHRIARLPVEGDSSHIDRIHQALLKARIRYQIVGGLDSRGRSWGHLTLVVPSLLGAGIHLRRAGFLESPESKYVLVDSRTGWKVRLLQGRLIRSK
jgi:hypothetical protein